MIDVVYSNHKLLQVVCSDRHRSLTMPDWNYLSAQAVAYFFQYVLWVTVSIVRILDLRIGVLDKSVSSRPTRIFRVPSSKDSRRKIVVDVYEPSNNLTRRGPLPVHVNFHGSGFVLPCHGSDAELCAHWAAQIGCVVLDSDYAKGPKYPYPAAIDDALDVFAYVTSRPDLFDLSKITVGGFSAGANIAIQSALRLAGEEFPVKAIVAWYPPTNMTREGTEKRATNSFRKWLYRSFRLCYLPAGIERADPRVSPVFADSTLFPPITLIVCYLFIMNLFLVS